MGQVRQAVFRCRLLTGGNRGETGDSHLLETGDSHLLRARASRNRCLSLVSLSLVSPFNVDPALIPTESAEESAGRDYNAYAYCAYPF